MFSYFGSKSKIVKYYPKPLYDIIIEPFAGSAQYAFLYWQKQVILIEKYERIYDVWDFLINEATPDFIMSLPLFKQGEKIVYSNSVVRDLIALESSMGQIGSHLKAGGGNYNRWAEPIRDLIALESCRGAEGAPRPSAAKFNRWSAKDGRGRKRIADNLHKIKHWKIIHGDYSLAPNIEATWFVDPPYYNKAGLSYKHNCMDIDYEKLGQWCRDRQGQVIVCEELGSSWLPFKYFMEGKGQSAGKRKEIFYEGIWTNTDDEKS